MTENAGRIRILVADDHPVVRTGLTSVLAQEADFDVIGEAENGERAIELARAHKPDVILMDLRMPIVDGIAATKAILAHDPDIRILALSSFDGDGNVRDALKAGARGYLLKDMLLSQVVAAVRAVYDGQRVLPPSVAEQLALYSTQEDLTPRELEVLALVARGLGNKAIASRLGRSDETVKVHLKNIFVKLGATDRTEAVTAALSRGLLRLPS